MKHIKQALEKYLKKKAIGKYKTPEKNEEEEIFKNWVNIAGEDLAMKAEPYKFSSGKLFLAVGSSVVLGELVYSKKDIREKVNMFAGREIVKEIVLRIKQ